MKDQRYKAIKSMIETKSISGLKDVFSIIPFSTVKEDMKINYNTLRNRVDRGTSLTMKDIIAMAALFEVDPVEVFRLAIADINKSARSGSKKKS